MPTGLRSGIFNLPAEKNSALAGCGGLARAPPPPPRANYLAKSKPVGSKESKTPLISQAFVFVAYSLAIVRNSSSPLSSISIRTATRIAAIGMPSPLSPSSLSSPRLMQPSFAYMHARTWATNSETSRVQYVELECASAMYARGFRLPIKVYLFVRR